MRAADAVREIPEIRNVATGYSEAREHQATWWRCDAPLLPRAHPRADLMESAEPRLLYRRALGLWCHGVIVLADPANAGEPSLARRRHLADLRRRVAVSELLLQRFEAQPSHG